MAQYKGKPLLKGNELVSLLQNYLPDWNLARIKLVVLSTQAVVKIGVRSLLEIAGAFDTATQRESSLRRIERFLTGFDFYISVFGHFMIALLGFRDKKVKLLLDRTEWKYGSVWVNVLMLSVSVEGMSVPLYWRVYNKKGLSSQAERIALMRSFFSHFPNLAVDYLIADREFIGKKWFAYLQEEAKISFLMRLKENFQASRKAERKTLKAYCRDVKPYQYYYKGYFKVCDTELHVSAIRIANELLILGSSERNMQVFEDYKKPWSIETLFKA